MTDLSEHTIDEIIYRQKPGHSLEQEFYTDDRIFQRDMQKIVAEQWLLIDHVT
jgi:stachydrine N-demethylase